MTKTKKLTDQLIRLTQLIEQIPHDERGLIVTGILEQIASEQFMAVPVSPEPITVAYTGMDGAENTIDLPDLLIQDSTTLQHWLTENRRECRYQVMTGTGVIITSMERIETQQDNFARLAEIYRQQLAAGRTRKTGRARKSEDAEGQTPKKKATTRPVTTARRNQPSGTTPDVSPPASGTSLPNLADDLMDNPVLNPNANASPPSEADAPDTTVRGPA